MPTSPSTPPSATSTVAIPIARWNALTDASSEPLATSARTRGGTFSTTTRASGCFSASLIALATSGRLAWAPSSSRSDDPYGGRHHRPHRGDRDQARHARDRVVHAGRDPGVVLVGVGQHGRGERRHRHRQPEGEHQQPGQQIGEVVDVGVEAQEQREPRGRHQRPHAHEEARPVAVGQRAEARGEQEHHERDRDRRGARLERAVARHLLQEQHEEEEQQPQPGVHRERLDVPDGEVAAPEQRQRKHRVRAARLPDHEAHEQDRAAHERHRHLAAPQPCSGC